VVKLLQNRVLRLAEKEGGPPMAAVGVEVAPAQKLARAAPGPGLLWALVVAGILCVVGSVLLAQSSGQLVHPWVQVVLINWITIPFMLSGLIAWRRRPDNNLGSLMVLAGFVTALSTLQWSSSAMLTTVGGVVDLLPAALFLHVFLAFPSGRLTRRRERILVAAAYVVAVALQVTKMLFGISPGGLLDVLELPAAATRIETVQLLTMSGLLVAGVALLTIRRRRTELLAPRPLALLVNAFGLGLLMLALLYVAGVGGWAAFETIRHITFGVLGLSPVVFLCALLDARLARSDIGELLVQLRADPDPDLRALLARALHDPSLSLAFWLPRFNLWVADDSRAIRVPDPTGERATRLIHRSDKPVAALLFDRSLEDERELLDAVSAAAGIALENGRLRAELGVRMRELERSRRRVLEAEQKERQRLERDLHDGAQQRLVALSLELGLLEGALATDPTTRNRLQRAERELAASLEELRDVAHGIHPAVLTGHGLAVALESLAATATVPVQLTVNVVGRLSQSIELTAYYVVSECLANVGKHAHATSTDVHVNQQPRSLIVEVVDNGGGGADPKQGSGLRGLSDRVDAAGGQLRIASSPDAGTRVRAEIPCR
jgi:signal transduction histidine kinase